jgi:hypothetical protein
MTTTKKKCAKCGIELDSNRKKFCSENCKWWFNAIKKENESHLPPVKKRNKDWCYVFINVGNSISERGQGRRSKGMVKGSMAANVNYEVTELRPFNLNNIAYHFSSKKGSGYIPSYIMLGDGTKMTKDEAEALLIKQDTAMYAAH